MQVINGFFAMWRYGFFILSVSGLLAVEQDAMASGFSVQYGKNETNLAINNVDYRFKYSTINLGFIIQPGIFVEIETLDDEPEHVQGGYQLGLRKRDSISLRLQSPEDLGMKAYFEFGWVQLELEGKGSNQNTESKSKLDASLIGFGMSKPFGGNRRHHWFLEMERLDNGDDFDTTGWSYGYRYELDKK